MKPLDTWLQEYAVSHRHPTNRWIHKICVPLIFFTLVGFFSLPRIGENIWTSAALPVGAMVLVFYARLGIVPFVEMLLALLACLGFCGLLEEAVAHPGLVYLSVFAVAWVGQFIGHYVEGARPSFFQDLQFLLIGPLWVLGSPPRRKS